MKANRGAAGVDGESLAMFEKDLKGNLYKIWNREELHAECIGRTLDLRGVHDGIGGPCRDRTYDQLIKSRKIGFFTTIVRHSQAFITIYVVTPFR